MKLCADELVHGRHEVVLLSRKELLGRPRRGRCTPDTQMNNTPVVARTLTLLLQSKQQPSLQRLIHEQILHVL